MKGREKMKKFLRLLVCITIVLSLCAACTKKQNSNNSSSNESDNSSSAATETALSANEHIAALSAINLSEPDTSSAAEIVFSQKSAKISGSGAEMSGEDLIITSGGTYLLSGQFDGRIIINAPKQDVTLVLNSLSVTCSWSSCIYAYKASSVKLYLPQNSSSTFSDGSSYDYNDEFSSKGEEEPNACVYSKADMIIFGSGSLTVKANFNNAVTGKDTLKIIGANLTVNAKNNCINGKDSLEIKNAVINATCGGDALRSTNDSDAPLGFIAAMDSQISIVCSEDGIQAETLLVLKSMSVNITAGDLNEKNLSSDSSAKGLKAGTALSIISGSYSLTCADDAVHSNGSIVINDGSFEISTGDDGIHADENVTVVSGTINITKSYEGIEGKSIDINGGEITVNASDDGLNAAGGADQSGFSRRMDSFAQSGDIYIKISGGKININASGDGIDSNGSLYISGGETYVSGPTDNGNGALDYDNDAQITGGIIVASGSSGMAQNFSNSSTQGSILLSFSSYSQEKIELYKSSQLLVSFTPDKKYNCVVISCPELEKGETYSVIAAGQTTSVTLTSLIYGSGFSGGGNVPGGGFSGNDESGASDNGSAPGNGNTPGGGNVPGGAPGNGGAPGKRQQNSQQQ